jgi:hypothetical protein
MTTGLVRTNISAPTRTIADSVAPAYAALSDGILDVPDTQASGTEYEIPFGGIGTGATLLHVKNKTGQALIVKINAATAVFDLANNGEITIVSAALPGSAPLTGMSLTTTATQSGAGTIEYLVTGDPA